MADTGNGQTLLGGGGGEQRAGAAEEDSLQFALVQLIEQIAAESNGTAAAAGAAGMDILDSVVEYQCAAVRQLSTQGQMIPLSQFQQRLLADLPQIAGDDQVEVLRFAV